MIILFTAALFLTAYAGLIWFYRKHWNRIPTHIATESPVVTVSVVIAARNEEKTLPHLIHDLQQQDYPLDKFEVIVVDDFSTDNTPLIGQSLPGRFGMISPDCLPAFSSKKKAIAAGVAAAQGELILVTDADCRVGEEWLKTIASFYQQTGAAFIAAPVRYTCESSVLQVLQALDFMVLQGITAATVSANMGTMCNGANLAYTRAAFKAVNGFEGIDSVPTGDDMLLMHKIWKLHPTKVVYLKTKAVIVTTQPMNSWKDFFMQRRRWASKTLVYDDKRLIIVLAFVLLMNLLPLVMLLFGFFHPVYFLCLFLFLVFKAIIEWPFVRAVARFYEMQSLLRYFFVLQPLHVLYTVVVGIWSQVGNYEWKGRAAHP